MTTYCINDGALTEGGVYLAVMRRPQMKKKPRVASRPKKAAILKKKRSPKMNGPKTAEIGVCWTCFRPGHLRVECPNIRARFGVSGYAQPELVAKGKGTSQHAEAEGEDVGLCGECAQASTCERKIDEGRKDGGGAIMLEMPTPGAQKL